MYLVPLTVVALLALGAVTAHVTETTARVASGLTGSTVTAAATAVSTTATAIAATAVATALGAVAGNVTPLATLVALLATTSASHAGSTLLGALTADVASTAAAVAGLLSLGVLTLAAHVALLAAVVASWGSLGRAVSSAVRRVSACGRISQCVNNKPRIIIIDERGRMQVMLDNARRKVKSEQGLENSGDEAQRIYTDTALYPSKSKGVVRIMLDCCEERDVTKMPGDLQL